MGVKTNDKRLLLRDQDVIGARFSNIETRQINWPNSLQALTSL